MEGESPTLNEFNWNKIFTKNCINKVVLENKEILMFCKTEVILSTKNIKQTNKNKIMFHKKKLGKKYFTIKTHVSGN